MSNVANLVKAIPDIMRKDAGTATGRRPRRGVRVHDRRPLLTAHGRPVEIVKLFGGRDDYLAAIRELETALYHKAA